MVRNNVVRIPKPTARKARRAIALLPVTAVLAVLTSSAPAGASPAAPPKALCAAVPAAKVSAVLGSKVGAPSAEITRDPVDHELKISSTSTTCTYTVSGGGVTVTPQVILEYEHLSSAPPEAALVADIKKSLAEETAQLPKGTKVRFSVFETNGVHNIFVTSSPKAGTSSTAFQILIGWKGTRLAGALVSEALPMSKMEDLEHLAIRNYGV